MLSLLQDSPFPDKSPIDANAPWKLGMDVEYLKKLKHMFLTEWSWSSLEKKIAQYDNFVVHYEHGGDALDLHFVHVRSPRSDAIPLMLLHGWPGMISSLSSTSAA
ncbi:alpha/beta-hydrolase [Sanghuangporus baumii]|uniref:Alpha/beta-hydrolase n=1 Tax=Sanghuangporus baumii TaxID=108892 RepID=A0A9Q5HVV8_SANBA|nr:alpha/beta-hydrolase [Sanghuangporus baumii]